jgi:hypothetical protein
MRLRRTAERVAVVELEDERQLAAIDSMNPSGAAYALQPASTARLGW